MDNCICESHSRLAQNSNIQFVRCCKSCPFDAFKMSSTICSCPCLKCQALQESYPCYDDTPSKTQLLDKLLNASKRHQELTDEIEQLRTLIDQLEPSQFKLMVKFALTAFKKKDLLKVDTHIKHESVITQDTLINEEPIQTSYGFSEATLGHYG